MAPPAHLARHVSVIVDGFCEELLEFLAETVRVPTVSGAEGLATDLYRQGLAAAGLSCEVQAIDEPRARAAWPSLGEEADLNDRRNLIARTRPRADAPVVVLNGHIDVVDVPDQDVWEDSAFSGARTGGRVHGRGACDMKGGLAAGIFAARAALATGVELRAGIDVQCVIGEETTGIGSVAAALATDRADAAIVLEPTNLEVVTGQGGMMTFEIALNGRASHGSTPWAGVSPLDKVLVLREAIEAFAARRRTAVDHPLFAGLRDPVPTGISTVSSSTRLGAARIGGRVGLVPGDDPASVRAEFERTAQAAAAADPWLALHPPHVSWEARGRPPYEAPTDHPATADLLSSCREITGDGRLTGLAAATDASILAPLLGVPALVFGPGDMAHAHAPNESIDEAQVVVATKVLALFLARRLSRS